MTRAAWALTAIALAGTGGVCLALRGPAEGQDAPAPAANSAQARIAPLRQVVREIGKLEPTVKVEVKSEISGRVARILVEAGDAVKTGQPLVHLDDRNLMNQLEQARIKVEQARLTEERQRRTFERRSRLDAQGGGLIPAEELEQARIEYEMAVVSRRDSENAVKTVEDQLRHTTIASPMDGLVIERAVSVGDVVIGSSSAGAPTTLATVADMRRMEVVVDVNEMDYPKLALGQAVELKSPALPRELLLGRITEIGLAGHPDPKNRNVITYTVKAEVTSPPAVLKSGMTATVDIITREKGNALVIPLEAVFVKEGKAKAVRIDGEGTRTVDLSTGLEGETEVEILSGLKEGDRVILGAWTEDDWEAYHRDQLERLQSFQGGRRRRGH